MSNKYVGVKGDSLERNYQYCPKCGPGYALAKHKDRESCGRCGYTNFQNKKKKK